MALTAEKMQRRIGKALNHRSLLHEYGISLSGASIVELGTGGHGIDLLLFAISGASNVATFDISANLKLRNMQSYAHVIKSEAEIVAEILRVDIRQVRRVVTQVLKATTLKAALSKIRCKYYVCEDANPFNSDWAPQKIDLWFTESNIQRIYVDAFSSILKGMSELMTDNSHMLHLLDCNDIHAQASYRTVDPNLHKLLYLYFSPKDWERITLRDQGTQNRLREMQFCKLFCDAGFYPRHIESYASQGDVEYLQSLPVHPSFLEFGLFNASIRRSRLLFAKRKPHSCQRYVYISEGHPAGPSQPVFSADKGLFNNNRTIDKYVETLTADDLAKKHLDFTSLSSQ